MMRKIWLVAVIAVAGVALIPENAEAARRRVTRRQQRRGTVTQPAPVMSAPVASTTAPPEAVKPMPSTTGSK